MEITLMLCILSYSGQMKSFKETLLKLNEKWMAIIIIMSETESFTIEKDLIKKR